MTVKKPSIIMIKNINELRVSKIYIFIRAWFGTLYICHSFARKSINLTKMNFMIGCEGVGGLRVICNHCSF